MMKKKNRALEKKHHYENTPFYDRLMSEDQKLRIQYEKEIEKRAIISNKVAIIPTDIDTLAFADELKANERMKKDNNERFLDDMKLQQI